MKLTNKVILYFHGGIHEWNTNNPEIVKKSFNKGKGFSFFDSKKNQDVIINWNQIIIMIIEEL